MMHARVAMRKPILVLLMVTLLTASLGAGIASAASTTTELERGTPTSDHGWGLCNYTVRPGDTLSAIARRFGTTVWYLASVNHLANPNRIRSGMHLYVPCGRPSPPPHWWCTYLVRPGDTLSRIALRYGTTVWYLASINHIVNPSRIYAWTYLRVPCWDP